MGEKTSEGKKGSATTKKGVEKRGWFRVMPRNYLSHNWKIVCLISGMIICCSIGFVLRSPILGTKRLSKVWSQFADIVKVTANSKYAPENGECYYHSNEYLDSERPISLNVNNHWRSLPKVYMAKEKLSPDELYLTICLASPSGKDVCFLLK